MTSQAKNTFFILLILSAIILFSGDNIPTAGSGGGNTTIYNNYTNGTGGGVSNLSNLTIDANKNWLNYSITNVSLPSDNTKVNKSGDEFNLTGNIRINMSNSGMVLGSYDTWDFSGVSYTFFSSNRFQSKSSGWQNLSYGDRAGATVIWENDIYSYWTTPSGSKDGFTKVFQLASNGLTLPVNGGGITMQSPNGNSFCTTVNNAGVLVTAAGACT